MARKFGKYLKEVDIFGQPISVLYQGSDVYKTRLGGFVTILTYVLVLINSIELGQDYFGTER